MNLYTALAADPFPVPMSLFSGANLLATNVAPRGSAITAS